MRQDSHKGVVTSTRPLWAAMWPPHKPCPGRAARHEPLGEGLWWGVPGTLISGHQQDLGGCKGSAPPLSWQVCVRGSGSYHGSGPEDQGGPRSAGGVREGTGKTRNRKEPGGKLMQAQNGPASALTSGILGEPQDLDPVGHRGRPHLTTASLGHLGTGPRPLCVLCRGTAALGQPHGRMGRRVAATCKSRLGALGLGPREEKKPASPVPTRADDA